MKLRISRLLAIATFAAGCALGSINSFAANVLFDDTFSSFTLGANWEVPAYIGTAITAGTHLGGCCNNIFNGAPNVILKAVPGGLRMTSAQVA